MALNPDDFHPEMQPDPPTWVEIGEVSTEVVLDEDPEEPEVSPEEKALLEEMGYDEWIRAWEDMMDEKHRQETGEC